MAKLNDYSAQAKPPVISQAERDEAALQELLKDPAARAMRDEADARVRNGIEPPIPYIGQYRDVVPRPKPQQTMPLKTGAIDMQAHLAMLQNLSPEQKQAMAEATRSNPMFAQALATRMGNPAIAVAIQRLFGPRQTPPLPQTGPTIAAAPPPQAQPSAMAMYAQNGQGQPPAAPQAMGTPRERSGTGAAPPTRNALSMYAN